MKKIAAYVLALALITGCSPSVVVKETETAQLSATIESTKTPLLTNTKKPTNTSEPSSTPKPTKTPAPTETNTPIPEEVVIKGDGDDVVDLDWDYGIALVEIVGNPSKRHFAVKSFDANNEGIDLLVNTTDVYYGVRLINASSDEIVSTFEVTAAGEWEITVKPINEATQLIAPGKYTGISDDVLITSGCTKATIEGNLSSKFLAVRVYSFSEGRNLLVNETDPYVGTVRCPKDTRIFEVLSEMQAWTITLE